MKKLLTLLLISLSTAVFAQKYDIKINTGAGVTIDEAKQSAIAGEWKDATMESVDENAIKIESQFANNSGGTSTITISVSSGKATMTVKTDAGRFDIYEKVEYVSVSDELSYFIFKNGDVYAAVYIKI